MSKATVYNTKGEKVKEIDLNPRIFSLDVNPEIVSQAIIVQQANKRQNFAHTKSRADVAGGGRKPWRQKGTGRARHGSIRSPLWKGGGVTFGPSKERNYSLKINKKIKQKALLMSLSDKATSKNIIFVDKLDIEKAKTKQFFEILQNLKLRDKKEKAKKTDNKKTADQKKGENDKQKTKSKKPASILLVLPGKNEKIYRASRNINRLDSILASSLNILDVVKNQYLLMPIDSIKEIEKVFVK